MRDHSLMTLGLLCTVFSAIVFTNGWLNYEEQRIANGLYFDPFAQGEIFWLGLFFVALGLITFIIGAVDMKQPDSTENA